MPAGRLAAAWLSAAHDARCRGDITAVGAELLRAYSEPHRCYHDLHHLAQVLDRVDELAAAPEHRSLAPGSRTAVRLAAWFHDAVYAGSPTDEHDSARLAEVTLARLGADVAIVSEVARLVELTATHDPAAHDAAGALLSDADLAILAADPQVYAQYAADVRREWPQIDDASFAVGRINVLRRLLERPRLFRTDAAAAWEGTARLNLATELSLLSALPTSPQP